MNILTSKGFAPLEKDLVIHREPHRRRKVLRGGADCSKPNFLTGFSKFQIAVYKATLKIPIGQTRTYSQIAKQIKHPRAVRAVANALAKNPLPFVIPCHRVIRKDGNIGGYRWGERLKKKLIQLEKIHIGSKPKRKTSIDK